VRVLIAALCVLALIVGITDGVVSLLDRTIGSSTAPSVARHTSPTPAAQPTTPPAPLPPVPAPTARAAILLNLGTGQVYLGRQLYAELPMASTTKIMSAVVALTFASPDQPITIGADASPDLVGTGASVAGLRQGDVLPLRDLLYALLVPSGDDAAIAIADGVAGSQERFVALMNAEAALIGLAQTHYNDVHGLDTPDHFTTVRDLARLSAYAMRIPLFAQIVRTAKYTVPATADHHSYVWNTTDRMLTDLPYQGILGIKTGFTGNAGACLVFAATRSQGTLLGVVLGEPDETARFTDAARLLDWGFVLAAQPPGSVPSWWSAI
jgi:serine-type D-Ala-D-Ala carboxypeptidase (penicillin-binding protein 5/6)